jgi:glycosyltransferase involved in cell wall biosynthesis
MADIVVLPSLWEGLPYVLIEAMAAGKAIVASGVGGVTDAVTDGENGLLIPPGDVDALAGALVCLLGDPELSERLGMNARATAVERYGIENMINRLEKVYESQAE